MKRTFLMMSIAVLVVGCSNDELSEEESQQAFAVTQRVLSSGASEANHSRADGIRHGFTCDEGGKVIFDGSFDPNRGKKGTFSYRASFENCASEGVVMNGDVDYMLDFKTTVKETSLEYTFNGNLDYSGDVEGGCTLHVSAKAGVSDAGAGYAFSGTVCGNEASSTLHSNKFSPKKFGVKGYRPFDFKKP